MEIIFKFFFYYYILYISRLLFIIMIGKVFDNCGEIDFFILNIYYLLLNI